MGGAGVRMVEAGIDKKVPLYGRTLGPTCTSLYRLRTEKGGLPYKGRQTQACVRNSLCCPAGEESADEQRRPAGGGGRGGTVGRSLRAQARWGGGNQVQRE